MPSYQSYLQRIKSEIQEITPQQVKGLLYRPDGTHIIDIREENEYVQGSIPGASWIPRGFLESRIEDAVPRRDAPIVLYCAGGNRSALSARARHELGYTNVKSMSGGWGVWKRSGYPVHVPVVLSAA